LKKKTLFNYSHKKSLTAFTLQLKILVALAHHFMVVFSINSLLLTKSFNKESLFLSKFLSLTALKIPIDIPSKRCDDVVFEFGLEKSHT